MLNTVSIIIASFVLFIIFLLPLVSWLCKYLKKRIDNYRTNKIAKEDGLEDFRTMLDEINPNRIYEGFDYIDYGIHDEYSNKTKRLAQSIYDLKDDLKLIKNDDPYFEAYRSISRVYIPAALSLAKIVSKQGTLDILKEDKEMLDSLSDKFETLRSDIKKVKKNEDKIKYDEWTSFL